MESAMKTQIRAFRLVLIISMTSYIALAVSEGSETCTSLGVCQGTVNYNMTTLPNMLKHESYGEALQMYNQFLPLLRSKCSPLFHKYLCHSLFPVCTILPDYIPVCRPMCEAALTSECLNIPITLQYEAAELFRCDELPQTGLCVFDNETSGTNSGSQTNPTPKPIMTPTPSSNTDPSESVYECTNLGVAGNSCEELVAFFGSRRKMCKRFSHACCVTCTHKRVCRSERPVNTKGKRYDCSSLINRFGKSAACRMFTKECCISCKPK